MPDPIFNGLLDELFAPGATIGVKAGDYTLTQSEYKDGDAFTVVGNTRAGARVNVPVLRQRTAWRADPAGTESVNVYCGGDPIELAPGDCKMLVTDKNGRISAVDIVASSGASSAWTAIDQADSPYQAASGQRIDLRGLTGNVTVLLPADPADYATLEISNQDGSLLGHTLTLDGAGNQVGSATLNSYTDTLTSTAPNVRLAVQFLDGKWSLT